MKRDSKLLHKNIARGQRTELERDSIMSVALECFINIPI